MSIENSFCHCDWDKTVELWKTTKSEDAFADAFFSMESTEEIEFPHEIHYHVASWELLEDFADWYRDGSFSESEDWDRFCSAWKQLGLMEIEEYNFGPINELTDEQQAEVVFGALSPESVKNVRSHLEAIDPKGLDKFFREHGMAITVPFSEIVAELLKKLDPQRGLMIFAG
ncbi:MAG: hypothetical protein P1U89_15090 [Verrucomicrobiales bacterium]|nr:hypothetical protein [Verrucomicrobiales bacterium]